MKKSLLVCFAVPVIKHRPTQTWRGKAHTAHRLPAVTEEIKVGSQGRNLEQEPKEEWLPTVFLSTACSPCPEGALHTVGWALPH